MRQSKIKHGCYTKEMKAANQWLRDFKKTIARVRQREKI
jgi:hypothetical protein